MFEKLNYSECKNLDDTINLSYKFFNENLFYGNISKLNNVTIKFVRHEIVEGKSNQFWHLTGLGDKELKNKILPCINDSVQQSCNENCSFLIKTVQTQSFGRRTFCLYRASRLPLINAIIELVNSNDHRIKLFHVMKGASNKEQLIMLVDEHSIKYLMILEIHRTNKEIDKFNLITAHPIFYKDVIRDLYNKYNKNLITSILELFPTKK